MTRIHRNGISKLTILIGTLVVLLIAVIIVSAMQEVKRTTPDPMATGPSTLSTGYVLRPFSASDLTGHTVDNTFFKKQRLTMVNVWGTFCGPCIREMPDLALLPAEFRASEFAILGIVADTPDTSNEDTARQLTGSTGVTYTNVIPDASIETELLADVSVVPTTFFVDRTGKVVGEVLTGSHTKAEWIDIIQGVLANLTTR
ncbi:MAG TPA: TlpA disulfide reductase family protein [Clostridia bacterium]|nr:TlpA disulfide reductase family protein [Clostridia bacterium]